MEKIYLLGKQGVFEIDTNEISIPDEEITDKIEEVTYDKFIKLTPEQVVFFKEHQGEHLDYMKLYNMETFSLSERIDQIAKIREQQYKKYSDHLYIAYAKYKEFGETQKARDKYEEWIKKIQEIEKNNPYPTK